MFNFCKEIETIFNIIAEYALNSGVNVYFVGGMVRDALMKRDMGDIDILVEGSAIVFAHGLKDFIDNTFAPINVPHTENPCGERLSMEVKSTHESFNTIKVQINGIEIDLASTREEEYPKSGCLPVVKNIGCPIETDLKRRDFTVNAMAARILWVDNVLKYELIDIFNGKEDLNKGILRVLHDKSYNDDPTRALRGIDFALRFNFTFSNFDKKLIEEFLKAPDREGLSIDRVKLTLRKLFSRAGQAKAAFKFIALNKIYRIWCDELQFKIEWLDNLIDAIKIFNIKSEEIFLKIFFENLPQSQCALENLSNYEIYNLYKNLETVDLALQYAIYNEKSAKFYFEKLKNIKPEITGADLMAQGFEQGRIIGEILNSILKEKLNDPSKFKKKQDEIDFVLKNFS